MLLVGAVAYALGVFLMPYSPHGLTFALSAGLLVGIGLSGTAFGIVYGAVGRAFVADAARQAHLRDLSTELSEAALMAVRDGDQIVYVAHEDTTDNLIAMRRLLGVRRPLHATSLGKAYLALDRYGEALTAFESAERAGYNRDEVALFMSAPVPPGWNSRRNCTTPSLSTHAVK